MKKYILNLILVMMFVPSVLFAGGKKDTLEADGVTEKVKPAYKKQIPQGAAIEFDEVWGYVMKERESEFDTSMPITDVGYFAAEVNTYGELDGVPDRMFFEDYSGRVHLVVVCESKSLTHFVLDPSYDVRKKLINQIMDAAKPYDGIQIDFELIPGRDADNFISFLKELSDLAKKQEKVFSVCVPARVKTISDDVFPYKKIGDLADKVIVMAYDEHWSTSKAGPIASFKWCQKIVDYSVTVIPQEKLVMGLPFYGRTWSEKKPAQAWYYSGINRIMKENGAKKVEYIDGIPSVKFNMDVEVTGFFEDVNSVVQKMRLYDYKNVKNIAFWRIGQEDSDVWDWIKIKDETANLEESEETIETQ